MIFNSNISGTKMKLNRYAQTHNVLCLWTFLVEFLEEIKFNSFYWNISPQNIIICFSRVLFYFILFITWKRLISLPTLMWHFCPFSIKLPILMFGHFLEKISTDAAIGFRILVVGVKFHTLYYYTIVRHHWQVAENHKARVHPSHVREIPLFPLHVLL